jgi:hypothetical protein
MGILDDAIKEHLELKRQHGAGESELKQLEDEAFGAAERPGDEGSTSDLLAEAPTQFMTQPEAESASPPPVEAPETSEAAESSQRRSPRTEIADLQEPPEAVEPAEEESPAMEHEAVSEPEPKAAEPELSTSGPSTEEREAIAEQPTEMFDVEGEITASEAAAPSEEDEADDFFDEKRLSDELDQALEAPVEDEASHEEEPQSQAEEQPPPQPDEESQPEASHASPDRQDEDVLEETPDFLEEAPEDDQLWFEQKPPKDFDFDD